MDNKYDGLFSSDMTRREVDDVYFSKCEEAQRDGTFDQFHEAFKSVIPAIVAREREEFLEGWLC